MRRGGFLPVGLALGLLVGAGGLGQTPPAASSPVAGTPGAGARDQLRERVTEALLHRMREVLQLSEAQTSALRPALAEMAVARRSHHRAHRERLRALHAHASDPAVPEPEIESALRALLAADRAFQDAERRREDAILALLTPRQRVRYLPLRERFADDLRRKLREMEERRGGKGQRDGRRGRGFDAGHHGTSDAPEGPPPVPFEP